MYKLHFDNFLINEHDDDDRYMPGTLHYTDTCTERRGERDHSGNSIENSAGLLCNNKLLNKEASVSANELYLRLSVR